MYEAKCIVSSSLRRSKHNCDWEHVSHFLTLILPTLCGCEALGEEYGLNVLQVFAEDDIWTWEGQKEMRMEKAAPLGASWFVPIIKYQGDKNRG